MKLMVIALSLTVAASGLGVTSSRAASSAGKATPAPVTFTGTISRTISFRLTRPARFTLKFVPIALQRHAIVDQIVGGRLVAVRPGQVLQPGTYHLRVHAHSWTITLTALPTSSTATPQSTPLTTTTPPPTYGKGCPPGVMGADPAACCSAYSCAAPIQPA
jgi:hypothetical protein